MLKGSLPYIKLLSACAVVICAVGYVPAAAPAEQKIALVIGNGAYPTSRLRNPANDANVMAEKLHSLGFDVMLRTDSGQREMTRAISQFGQKLAFGSVGLFYYAGHGVQVRGKNYLVPIDAEIESEGSVLSEAVDVDQVLAQLGQVRLAMVILDACRNNPFERKFRSTGGGGLAQIDAPTGTLLAYATAPGKVAADGNGANSLYTDALLKALDMPGLKVEDVFKQVRIQVLKASENRQIPWESSSLTGEFYFREPMPGQSAIAEINVIQQQRLELQKALEEERRRRDEDAETVRKEMDKLRNELLRMGTTTVAGAAGTTSSGPSTAATTKPAIVATQPPSSTTVPQAPPTTKEASGWKARLELLEQNRGKLTFAKAFAILLDITGAEELTGLLKHESDFQSLPYQRSYALGVGQSGKLTFGVGARWPRLNFAADTALEHCSLGDKAPCKVILENGNFKETAFFDVVRLVQTHDYVAVRQAFLASIQLPFPPAPPMQPSATGTITSGYGFGLSTLGHATGGLATNR